MTKISVTRLFAALLVMCLFSGAAYTLVVQKKGPSQNEARQVIRRFAGIELPSDAVTVKDVSSLGSSAVVIAQIETAFRLVRGGDGKWQVAEVRAGDNRWEDVELLRRALNREKTARARAEIESLATALESFKRESGFYVSAKDSAALTDQLNPRYLPHLIRFDPWHRPYQYEGDSLSYTISSHGPDGQASTADDVTKRSASEVRSQNDER
ncbi:MAG: type II secretion system protein GspG [Pyrinomonadaceae bacterium]